MTPAGKHPLFVDRWPDPYCGGPPLDLLVRDHLTPIPLFFVRDHGNVPEIDPRASRLRVHGHVRRRLELSLGDLRESFAEHSETVTLQCAGNRRQELMTVQPIEGEVAWGPEAIGTAVWTGVRLADVLTAAGVKPEARHVEFTGMDRVEREGDGARFGGSIPIERARRPEVLLAWAMNGRPLEPEHGFPLRVVVPGVIGARSVKWLASIELCEQESSNYFQQCSYKVFPATVGAGAADWGRERSLQEFPVNAVIGSVGLEPAGPGRSGGVVRLRGYAVSGAGPITRVEVSLDGGRSWIAARLEGRSEPWSWRLWDARIPFEVTPVDARVRAFDSRGGRQPDDPASIWNFKGYMNNAWHRVELGGLEAAGGGGKRTGT